MAGLRFVPLLAALSALLAASSTVPVNTVTYDTRACQAPYNTYPFCNTTLSLDERIADLISRLEPSDIPPMLTARHGGRNGENNCTGLPFRV